MCAPSIIALVRSEWSRRQLVGGLMAGAGAVAAAACGSPREVSIGMGEARPVEGGGPPVRLPSGFTQVFDLTHVLSPETPVFPAFRPMRFERLFTIEKDGFTCGELTLNEHTRAFLNIDSKGTAHLPGFTGEAAEFLVKERDIVGVGVDTVSLDMGTSASPVAHLAFLGAGKYGVEVISNLGGVPAAGATVIVGAPKHKNGTGGPVRLLAVA